MSEGEKGMAAENGAEMKTIKHVLLIVDDEENILNALRRLFRKEPYQILTTVHAQEGLELAKANPVSLVISDHRMPEMEGTEFLARLRDIRPDAIRIMLTGYADIKAVTDAINRCQVYRFIAKPWNDDDLRLTVREALRMFELIGLNREMTELVKKQNQEMYDLNRELEGRVRERTAELEKKNEESNALYRKLEGGLLDTVRMLTGLIELKSHFLAGRVRRVAAASRGVAARMGLQETDQILCEMAALLMDVGTLGYSDELLSKQEDEMNDAERVLYEKHSLLGEAGIKGIEGLEAAARVVRSHHERFDGNGFPDRLKGDKIPLPARIVAAADFYDGLTHIPAMSKRRLTGNPVKEMEKGRGTRFDPSVVTALLESINVGGPAAPAKEIEISFHDLKEGMRLSRDLMTRGGIILLPAGSVLQSAHLGLIPKFHGIDPVVERVYISGKD